MRKPGAKNVILFGMAGLDKSEFAKKLKKFLVKKDKISVDIFNIDDEINALLPRGMIEFLELGETDKRDEMDKATTRLAKEIASSTSRIRLVCLHACFSCGGLFSFPLTQEHVAKLRPSLAFTLVDDAYAIRHRLKHEGHDYEYLCLLQWRDIELAIADQLIPSNVENILLATKHPLITFKQLIFEPKRLRCYVSFPISSTRNSKAKVEEINKFRQLLHKKYISFDPVTMDDRILILEKQGKNHLIEHSDRWPYLFKRGLSSAVTDEANEMFPLKVTRFQKKVLSMVLARTYKKSLIDLQIRARDFRYIQQADAVIAYRPMWDGAKTSRGVSEEITFARAEGKEVVVFMTPRDEQKLDKTGGTGPFGTTPGNFATTQEGILARIDKTSVRR